MDAQGRVIAVSSGTLGEPALPRQGARVDLWEAHGPVGLGTRVGGHPHRRGRRRNGRRARRRVRRGLRRGAFCSPRRITGPAPTGSAKRCGRSTPSWVLNAQADEPLIPPSVLDRLGRDTPGPTRARHGHGRRTDGSRRPGPPRSGRGEGGGLGRGRGALLQPLPGTLRARRLARGRAAAPPLGHLRISPRLSRALRRAAPERARALREPGAASSARRRGADPRPLGRGADTGRRPSRRPRARRGVDPGEEPPHDGLRAARSFPASASALAPATASRCS